jgi:hypothetical protein
MSVVWNDEYDPSELDGFRFETEPGWESFADDQEFDAADAWLAAQDVPDWTIEEEH